MTSKILLGVALLLGCGSWAIAETSGQYSSNPTTQPTPNNDRTASSRLSTLGAHVRFVAEPAERPSLADDGNFVDQQRVGSGLPTETDNRWWTGLDGNAAGIRRRNRFCEGCASISQASSSHRRAVGLRLAAEHGRQMLAARPGDSFFPAALTFLRLLMIDMVGLMCQSANQPSRVIQPRMAD